MKEKNIKIITTSLTILMIQSAYSEDYVIVVDKENNNYIEDYPLSVETDIKVTTISEINCVYSPEKESIYNDKVFDQNKNCETTDEKTTTITTTYKSGLETEDETTEIIKGDKTTTITEKGTHLEQSCKEILLFDNTLINKNSLYKITNNENVYCDMTREGGGWTLIASLADDNRDTWFFDSTRFWNAEITGSPLDRKSDYQSKLWEENKANELMISDSEDSKYLVYTSLLNDETLSSKYNASVLNSNIYTASKVSGSWWVSVCSNITDMHMKTMNLDNDSAVDHIYATHSRGFVWSSVGNGSCSWDDSAGGLSASSNTNNAVNKIENWNLTNQFYERNFKGSALNVFIK